MLLIRDYVGHMASQVVKRLSKASRLQGKDAGAGDPESAATA